MTTIVDWPANIKEKFLRGNFRAQEDPNARISTSMATGPTKRRARYLSGSQKYTITVWLSRSEYESFLTFYRDTLVNGTHGVRFRDPLTLQDSDFAITSAPTANFVGWNTVAVSFGVEAI